MGRDIAESSEFHDRIIELMRTPQAGIIYDLRGTKGGNGYGQLSQIMRDYRDIMHDYPAGRVPIAVLTDSKALLMMMKQAHMDNLIIIGSDMDAVKESMLERIADQKEEHREQDLSQMPVHPPEYAKNVIILNMLNSYKE
ncbi:MAG: hypothetical protein GXP63_07310 [DPANN group archaeon]|nr:hypothetical protein [DPANN group archaeon]